MNDVARVTSGGKPAPTRRRLDLFPYVLLAPSLIALALIIFYPIVQVIILSLQNGNLLKGGAQNRAFIGLANYATAFEMSDFWNSLWVSALYALTGVVASYALGLFFALLLSGAFRGRGLARALAIAPWAMPPVVTSIVWMWMYDPQFGVINYILQQLQIISENMAWLNDPTRAMPAVIAVTVWKHIPLAMMVLLAGLQSIPSDLYEAARIDGATPFDEFRYVTMPGLKPVTVLIVLMLTLWIFKEFTYVYVLTGGGPGRATETIVLQVYYQAFKYLDFGVASAIGIVVMLICLAFSAVYLPLAYGKDEK